VDTVDRRERVRREIVDLCYRGVDSMTLRREAVASLRKVVSVDGTFFATVDPSTLLYSSAFREGMPADVTPQFLRNEFMEDDVNKVRHLATAIEPVNWLDQATAGDRELSPRYREVMRPIGFGDELRAAVRADGWCWGFLCLHRQDGAGGFSIEDARFVSELVPHLAAGLRRCAVAESALGTPDQEGPGVFTVAPDWSISAATPAAQKWLAELADGETIELGGLPVPVYAMVEQLHGLCSDDLQRGVVPSVRVRARSGRWLTLHGSYLSGDQIEAAVIIEPSDRHDLAPLIIAAYGLTAREGQVTQDLLRGAPTKEIATHLSISAHTVNDHIKAVFDKTGSRSRGDLLGRVFAAHYSPTRHPDPTG
jgi:DNA-binding CsgD family transcriptional regulator